MSNENKHDEFDQGDAWGEMGLGGADQQASGGQPGDSYVDPHSSEYVSPDGAAGGNPGEEVVDVEAAPKKKSKAGIYAAIAIVGVIALVVVWAIFSKMMAVMSPNRGADQAVSTLPGDIRPLEAQPQEPAVALPGGAVPAQTEAPAAPAAAPVEAVTVQAPAAQPAVAAAPAQSTPVAACAPSAAAVCADTSGKDREISALKDDLEASKSRVAELESKLKKPVASKPVASKPVQSSLAASGQNKIVRGKLNEQKTDAKPTEQTQAVVQPVTAPVVSAAPVAPVEKKDAGGPSSFRLRAIYPNTGDYKAAHLVDPSGKNIVVRVGDSLRSGARVTAINVDDWRVITTEGEIR